MKRTPFYQRHLECGARIVPFAGWDMPVSYTGIIEEHMKVRQDKGWFDVSHMGEFWVTGSEAETFLDHILTNRISGTREGKAVYSPMCNEEGGVVDDLIVYCRKKNQFLVVVNASNREKDLQWMREKSEPFQVKIEDVSDDWALLALQGPKALSYLREKGWTKAADLPRFGLTSLRVGGLDIICSRTGYTGEDGVEIFLPANDAMTWFHDQFGKDSVDWIGLGARDSLRLEAGLPLYGHEMSTEINPVEAGFGWAVHFKKEKFIGREALQNVKAQSDGRRVRFFVVEDRRIAREGAAIYNQLNEPVGTVLSGTQSPILGRPIGSALLNTRKWVDRLEVDVRGKRFPLRFHRPPLQQWTTEYKTSTTNK